MQKIIEINVLFYNILKANNLYLDIKIYSKDLRYLIDSTLGNFI